MRTLIARIRRTERHAPAHALPRTAGTRVSRPLAVVAVGLAALTVLSGTGGTPGPVESLATLVSPANAEEQPRTFTPRPGPEAGAFVAPAPLEGEGAPIRITGRGWGHSVGMSQYGAQAQALSGWDHARILGHWYPGTELTTHAAAERGIAVNLFLNRPEVATDHVVVQTAGGDGVDPNTVQLGEGAHVHAVPRPQAWTVRHDGEAFTLADASGTVVDRGPGPVVVRYGAQERPSRLRLPQLGTSDPLAGSFRWGTLRITVNDEGVLNPVIHLPVEAYLRGLAEMPSGWQPAALAAQAVAGRGYAVRQVLEGLDPVCDCHLGTTPHDQAYAGLAKEGGMFGDRWVDAVRSTTSQVLEYEGELAWTYYSSSHAGRTENSGDSWAYPETLPYLPSVDDPWSADPRAKNPMRTWEREIPNAEFSRHVGLARVLDVAVVERTEGGTPRVLAIRGLDADGNEVALDFRGWRKPIAGAHLKLSLRSTLPSMQIDAIEVLAP